MNKLENQVFICIDCETTGLDAKADRIIEVGAMRFTIDKILDQWESLIDPGCVIPETSIEIHHISQEMVAGKPTIVQMLPQIIDFVGNEIIIGHGVGFDVEVLAIAAERAGIPQTLRSNRTLDTLRMARLYGESPINSLEMLRQHFNIQFEGPHRAMSDVIVNVEVFKHLAKKFRYTEQIFEALSRPILMKVMPLGKHKGRPMKELPVDYLRRMANMEFDQDLLYSIRTELSRRKKGNLFSQAGNPFGDL